MIIGEIIMSGSTPVATQIHENDSWCETAKELYPNKTPTRLGYCTWCWGEIKETK